ncbi:conserved hypothetical protein [Theileria orientalis strain Shintoku]|uniref:Uncharacterized protein n=1 Tax=Theileria orientalis strain Shintoku TaxID=869250 RepID=J4C8U9_THEOR|nr:conserved hypothetical protein [Theileria orientalis strain Shintoku]PVC54177.1 hypothetical protein MACL_00003260 [Theileria orientalis]BAM41418.1 conserved hypothetical protein [Theileria orientalis strain Shintoku]|eukprot:XP_009691719.1 conserved hypothetical protein [Theileria orientalis strain Shintoku]
MNFDLLKTRLKIDQVNLWNKLNELVGGHKNEDRDTDSDLTLEYYVDLITRLVRGMNEGPDKDSKHVQTESALRDDDFERALDVMENNNRMLDEYWAAVSNLIMYPRSGIALPKECLDNFDWNIASKVLNRVECVSDRRNFCRFLQLMEEKDALLNNVIASQHLVLSSLRQGDPASRSNEGSESLLKSSDNELSRLRMELETFRSQKDLFNVRLELYRSELSRIYQQCEPSLTYPPIINQ